MAELSSPGAPDAVCVLGLGLIGGSLLRAAGAAGRPVIGYATDPRDREGAAACGLAVAADEGEALRWARQRDALVVLAVPLQALPTVVTAIDAHAPDCALTDVVSVKSQVADIVAAQAPRARYVGGHPMAGGTATGFYGSDPGLFRRACWAVVTEPQLPPEPAEDAPVENDQGLDDADPQQWPPRHVTVWRAICRLALDCGAFPVPVGAARHDAAVARISHLPHLVAAALAATGAQDGPLALGLAAGSFRDAVRVAGAPVELNRALCEGNRESVLEALDDLLGRLGAARGSLASSGTVGATMEQGNSAHRRWQRVQQHRDRKQQLRLDAPGWSQLLAAAEHGARIRDFTGPDGVLLELPEDQPPED